MRARTPADRLVLVRSGRLVRSVILAAALVLLAAGCEGDGGGGGGADDVPSGGSDTAVGLADTAAEPDDAGGDTAACAPACDPSLCLACEKGACVSTCGADETCVDGACQPPVACTTDADCTAPCAACDTAAGTCASACTGDERCHEGAAGGAVCEVPPACDCGPCEACDRSDVWAPSCATECTGDELCHGDGDDAICEVPPTCDCGPCEACDDSDVWAPSCATRCTGEELCDETGDEPECRVPPACDCGPCEACDQTNLWDPSCAPVCDTSACEACGEDGETCVTTCDEAACEACDGAGGCVSTCDAAAQYCRDGACLERPDVACDDVDGFCDGTIIDELVLEGGPDDDTGDPGCCCDFTGDGVVDNALADLIVLAEPFLGYDRAYFNQGIAAQINAGSLLLLIEYLGLDDDTDDDYVTFNLYLGADANDDPTDNLTGGGEFWVDPASLDADGAPLMSFADGWVEDGRLHGGPAQFLMPVDLVGQELPILLVVDGATVEADITQEGLGATLTDGVVCGWLHRDKIAAGVNQFTDTNCGCLGYEGDFIRLEGGTMQCAPIAQSSCSNFDYVGRICNQLADACGGLALVLPALFDLDLTDDGKGDALSLGVTFGGTSGALVGVRPSR